MIHPILPIGDVRIRPEFVGPSQEATGFKGLDVTIVALQPFRRSPAPCQKRQGAGHPQFGKVRVQKLSRA
jgi:hypothetical protein